MCVFYSAEAAAATSAAGDHPCAHIPEEIKIAPQKSCALQIKGQNFLPSFYFPAAATWYC